MRPNKRKAAFTLRHRVRLLFPVNIELPVKVQRRPAHAEVDSNDSVLSQTCKKGAM